MRVVTVQMLVREHVVDVIVRVAFAHVEPYADYHEHPADQEPTADRIAERSDRYDGPDERRGGKIGGRPCGAEMAESQHEEHQADSITEQAHDSSAERGAHAR